ncbi:MAG TPA: proton-conducting transporter membrane subunit, partial [Streptosporangiaceae bacterium]|nr:proton-conducting transporter membrane subunit [Streptosporangiaceae bacterium]
MPATGALKLSWLLLAFPLFGAVVLLVGGRRTNRWGHLLGCVMPVAAFVYGAIAYFTLLGDTNREQDQHVYTYILVGRFQANVNLLIDPLSICFILLITGVGSLIIIYSVGYMAQDPNRRKFFGYMNLFIASMLLLVLADNYLVLYVGWEGVGLASYLLIGFWQDRNSAAVAAKKAFVVNRVGDAGLTLAIFLMFSAFGTVSFTGVFHQVPSGGSGVATALGFLLLLGACGKSAQVPLQSWLLDAMEGPTP